MDIKENIPELWIDLISLPKEQDHKYTRGQVVVMGGEEMTGAACLAADMAAKSGAGMVTIIAPKRSLFHCLNPNTIDPLPIYKNFRPYIIARREPEISDFIDIARKKGKVVGVIGPGLGDKDYAHVRRTVLDVLGKGKDVPLVIDADGLNAFMGNQENKKLCEAMHSQCVLTPHEGEFCKLFPHLVETLGQDRQDAAMRGANFLSGGVLVLKGSETIIAQATQDEERIFVNKVASPHLATAGSGDVLAGLIAGLIAQGMPAFEAAASGVWIHGKTAQNIGIGLVAEDLIKNIPGVLKEILGISKKVR